MPRAALPHLEQQLAVRLLGVAQRLAAGRARKWRIGATQRVRVRAVNVVRELGNAVPQILLSGHELGGCVGRRQPAKL